MVDGALKLCDVVEPALARALVLAAEAQRWELVARIAEELAARRSLRAANTRDVRAVTLSVSIDKKPGANRHGT